MIVGRMLARRFASLLCLLAPAAAAQSSNPFANDPAAAEIGRGVFRIYCAPCHGIRAQGGRGPDLSRGAFNSGDRDTGLFRTISQGVPGSEMTGFAGVLTDENIWRIVGYLQSLAPAVSDVTVKGDPVHGEALFRGKGKCLSCHSIETENGRAGPDLSRIGRQRSIENLRESIVDPSADIADGYRTVSVVTHLGARITGIERGIDNFTVQISDLSGRFYSFDREQLQSLKRETRSLMPDNYGRVLTPDELENLLAYLSTLRGQREPR